MTVLTWVPPKDVTDGDWEALARAGDAGPKYERIPQLRIEHHLRRGEMHLFRFNPGPGVLLIETPISASGVKRLCLLRANALPSAAWTFRQLADLLIHTAREWGCQEIETMVYSQRLAEAFLRAGFRTEAVKLVLGVENGNGQ